jgi:hypothetical protein
LKVNIFISSSTPNNSLSFFFLKEPEWRNFFWTQPIKNKGDEEEEYESVLKINVK